MQTVLLALSGCIYCGKVKHSVCRSANLETVSVLLILGITMDVPREAGVGAPAGVWTWGNTAVPSSAFDREY